MLFTSYIGHIKNTGNFQWSIKKVRIPFRVFVVTSLCVKTPVVQECPFVQSSLLEKQIKFIIQPLIYFSVFYLIMSFVRECEWVIAMGIVWTCLKLLKIRNQCCMTGSNTWELGSYCELVRELEWVLKLFSITIVWLCFKLTKSL